jgi:glycosyltransferase involved in cell wall biosynthesis
MTIAEAATSLLARIGQRSALDNRKCIDVMEIEYAANRIRTIYDEILKKRFPSVVMICTEARGGIRSVVEQYKADGLFLRWNVLFISSHKEGIFIIRLLAGIKAVLCVILLILKHRALLVHCHAAMKNSFWRKSFIAMVSRFAGVPVVFHLHGSEMKNFVDEQPRWLQAVISRILSRQSVVVVLSESWASYIKSVAPMAHIEILPNYVQMPILGSDINAERNEETVNVLFLGVVGARKGVYDLLPAFKDAVAQNPSLRLILGGNGEIDRAQALAAELKINDYVTFPGWLNGKAKVDLLRRANIFVLPSRNENFPVSLLEAMSWQVPVISSRQGGISDMVRDGVDGILIEAGDRVALTSAMVELARNADLRRKMGISARERVEQNFSGAVILPKLEGIYNSLCNTTARSAHI